MKPNWGQVEPTEEMILAGIVAANRQMPYINDAQKVLAIWKAMQARATPALPQPEHDLQDIQCQCCGYMTYHREHMGCIRAAYKQALPQGERKCSDCGNDEPYLSLYCVRCLNNDGWHQVPEGMAIVPVDALNRIMELAGVALVYQPFGTKDRQHFDALMAIIEDKP